MKKLDIDKDVLSETSNLQLLSTLAMLAPFNKIDKQAILEAATGQLGKRLDAASGPLASEFGPNLDT